MESHPERHEEIPSIGHRVDEWSDDLSTIVDEPFLLCIRKLEALPTDTVEDFESVRGQLHATVDHLVDCALESVQELKAVTERSERQQAALNAELECVIRHSNALVQADAPRRRDDTLIEFPTALRPTKVNRAARPARPRRRNVG